VEKAVGATRLAVFGDSLAIDLSRALERFYAEDPNLVVINQGVSSSGFVRFDYFDWDAAITEQLAADSFDLAVVIIGINDRQELVVNGQRYPPLTDGWVAAYQARIASFLDKLRAARKPVIWMGLPPMSRSEYSAAISQISNIQRLASFSGGAEFLDIYQRFLGEDGKYSDFGPDVNGQNARMRKDDGIHFSAAGSDKLAFYLNQTIRSFYRGGSVSIAVADPLLGTDAAAMLRPPFQGLGQIRLLEVAGAVVPISRVPARAGDLLLAGDLPAAAPFSLEQLVTAPIGRADAFGVGMGQVAVALGVVDAIADDEFVGNVEADPFGGDIGLAAAGLVEQGADFHAAGMARVENFQHMLERVAGIDDIFHHQHIAPGDLAAQILQNAHFPARCHGIAIGGGFEEIDLDRQVQLAHQIGDEDEGTAQQADNHQLVGAGIIGRNLPRQSLHAGGNGLGGNQFVDDIGLLSHGAEVQRQCPYLTQLGHVLPPLYGAEVYPAHNGRG
jgi:lysophospholipase L1-like esterase